MLTKADRQGESVIRVYHKIRKKMKIKLSNRAANKIARKQRRINRLNKK